MPGLKLIVTGLLIAPDLSILPPHEAATTEGSDFLVSEGVIHVREVGFFEVD